ncbi:MAG: glutamine synthetase family protein [Ardenticatenaceae bacterium]|nr:glutamine synthetase family protein [Ardenticatenaceae bacterium]HBY94390.1 glutamine synthetase [Chloroflexota bacterium]
MTAKVTPAVDPVLRQIESAHIQTVKIEFPDLFGVARTKVVPARHFGHVAEHGIQFAFPTFALDLAGNPAAGTGTAEETGYADMTAVPDLGTFTILPWEPNTAAVIADLYYQNEPVALAPRNILKRIIAEYERRKLLPLVGSELEFYLLKSENGTWRTYSDKPSMVYTWNSTIDPDGITRKMCEALEAMGHRPLAVSHEFFPGQFEINLDHGEALDMADRTFFFKQAVKEIAWQNGLMATFMAKPRSDLGGSGYHLHLSLADPATRANLFYDPRAEDGLADLARYFTGGQIEHARGLTAVFAPTINSYKRYVPGAFAPYYVLWGYDNRTCYVRIPPERKGGTRVENRTPDGVANPYLVFAAALAAGLDGIDRRLDPGPAFAGDAYMTADGNSTPVVPQYLHEAIRALEADEVLCQMMGPAFVKAFGAVKRLESDRFRAYVTDWEFNEYAFHL